MTRNPSATKPSRYIMNALVAGFGFSREPRRRNANRQNPYIKAYCPVYSLGSWTAFTWCYYTLSLSLFLSFTLSTDLPISFLPARNCSSRRRRSFFYDSRSPLTIQFYHRGLKVWNPRSTLFWAKIGFVSCKYLGKVLVAISIWFGTFAFLLSSSWSGLRVETRKFVLSNCNCIFFFIKFVDNK